MRKITFYLLLLGVLAVCCKKRDNPVVELGPDDLAQTTWICYAEFFEGNRLLGRNDFILEFISSSKGFRVDIEEDGYKGRYDFDYTVRGRKISFPWTLGTDWTILEYTGNHMKLQAFLPERSVMTMTKMY